MWMAHGPWEPFLYTVAIDSEVQVFAIEPRCICVASKINITTAGGVTTYKKKYHDRARQACLDSRKLGFFVTESLQ